jgi:2-polyprenyl-6-methoxyphenol hydroxylase-like FAD-dependent oxidoreductase
MSVDVLIIGAGPTGLLLAAQLARYGIKPRLVDKNPEPSKTSKAIAVFARTLEIFDHLGIAEEAIKRGRKLNQFNFYADRQRIVNLRSDQLDSFLPLVLCLPQSQTEDILGRLVENLGVKIERSVTFTSLQQDADSVTAILCHPDGQEENCRASWLIGCDGARSTVRQEVGLVDKGANLPGLFILADAQTNWSLSPNEVHIFLNSDGVFAVFPLPEENYWRIIADLPPDMSLPEGPDLKLFEQLAHERSRLKTQLTNPLWTSTFRIRQRNNLLLFGGKFTQKVNCVKLSQIAEEVEEKCRDRIDVHILLLNSQIPEELEWFKSVLLDPQGKCHHRYSATGECLYLIRPDGYIGYRTQPADVFKLWTYLQKLNLFQSVDEMYSPSLSK